MHYFRKIFSPHASERPKHRVCLLPQRYIIALLLFCGVLLNFTSRVSFKIAFDHMLKPINKSVNLSATSFCKSNETATQFVPVGKNLYDWSKFRRRMVYRVFFGGYFLGHFPGGYLSDKYGGKIVLSSCTLATICLTVLTPIVLTGSSADYHIMVARQALAGFSMGMLFPSANSILAHWAPVQDRGKLSCIVFCATQFAVVFSDAVSVSLVVQTNAWSSILYLYSGMAAVWTVVWQIFGHSTYRTNFFATKMEFDQLEKAMADLINPQFKGIPWTRMLCSIPLWALVLAQFGHTWIWHVLIKDLPEYMKHVLQYDLKNSYLVASLPYLTMGVLTVANGFLVDWLINRKCVEITTNRKVFTTIGAAGPAIFLVAATYAFCARKTAVFLFTVGMSLMSFYYAGTRVNTLDLAPNYSGMIMGIVNGIGAIPGLIVPQITNQVVKNNTHVEWGNMFWIHLSVLFATCICFAVFGSGKVQAWNNDEDMVDTVSEVSDMG